MPPTNPSGHPRNATRQCGHLHEFKIQEACPHGRQPCPCGARSAYDRSCGARTHVLAALPLLSMETGASNHDEDQRRYTKVRKEQRCCRLCKQRLRLLPGRILGPWSRRKRLCEIAVNGKHILESVNKKSLEDFQRSRFIQVAPPLADPFSDSHKRTTRTAFDFEMVFHFCRRRTSRSQLAQSLSQRRLSS